MIAFEQGFEPGAPCPGTAGARVRLSPVSATSIDLLWSEGRDPKVLALTATEFDS